VFLAINSSKYKRSSLIASKRSVLNNVFLFILGSTVFYPADAVSTERSIELAANTKGICFVRTSRPATAIIYKNDEVFEVIIIIIKYS
jgi:transketolase C-terminal domain/subunit